MNSSPIKENKVLAAARRKARQAEALRANLRRRKAETAPDAPVEETREEDGENQA